MKENIRTTTLRFNLDKELDRKAWNYLQTMDHNKYPSYSQAAIISISDHFDRQFDQDGSDASADAGKEDLIQSITESVERTLERTLPPFLAGCLAGITISSGQSPSSLSVETFNEQQAEEKEDGIDPADIDWDILEGA